MRVIWDITDLPLDQQMRDQYFKFLDVELTKKMLEKGYMPKQYLIDYVHLKSNPAFIDSEKFVFSPQEFEERKIALKQLSELFNSRGLVIKSNLTLDKYTYPIVPNMVAVYQHLYKHLNKQANKVRGSRSPGGAKSPTARRRSRSRSISRDSETRSESHSVSPSESETQSRSGSPVPFAVPVNMVSQKKTASKKKTATPKKKTATPKKKTATPKKKTATPKKKTATPKKKTASKKKTIEVNVVPMSVPTAFVPPTSFTTSPPVPFTPPTPFAVPTRI